MSWLTTISSLASSPQAATIRYPPLTGCNTTGDLAASVYTVVLPDGTMLEREPEMLVMSKRPAIGREWFQRFGKHVYVRDKVVARGKEMQPPRYYDKLLPEVVRGIVTRRRAELGDERKDDHTDDRNNVRDVVVRAGLNQYERD